MFLHFFHIYIFFYFFSPSFCIFIENRYFAYTAAIDSCRIVTGALEEADGKRWGFQRKGGGASEENSEKQKQRNSKKINKDFWVGEGNFFLFIFFCLIRSFLNYFAIEKSSVGVCQKQNSPWAIGFQNFFKILSTLEIILYEVNCWAKQGTYQYPFL